MMIMTLTIASKSQEWGVCADVSTSNSGVGMLPTINEEVGKDKVEVPRELDSNFWGCPSIGVMEPYQPMWNHICSVLLPRSGT